MLLVVDGLDVLWRHLHDLAGQHMGPELGARVVSLARPAVRLTHRSGHGWTGEGSRLGGSPVLVPGTRWPTWEG
jgi:hypothetical protein